MILIFLFVIAHHNRKVQMQIRHFTYQITKKRYQIKYNKGIKLDTFRVKLGYKPHYINVLKELNMTEQLIANYINKKRLDAGLTYEAIAKQMSISESTVKNLCTNKTDNPGIKTIIPILEAVGGSFDEMLYPNKNKDEIKETSVLAMKDIYENQLTAIKESYDEQISNIRGHYEQHHQDLVDNFEKRLADKREIIEMQKRTNRLSTIVAWTLGVILIGLLVAEVMNPNLGWLRF